MNFIIFLFSKMLHFLSMFLLHLLDFFFKSRILIDKGCLIWIVLWSVFLDRDASLCNVYLEFMSGMLWLLEELLLIINILSEIIDQLWVLITYRLVLLTSTFSLRAITVVLRCSISTSFSLSPFKISLSIFGYSMGLSALAVLPLVLCLVSPVDLFLVSGVVPLVAIC